MKMKKVFKYLPFTIMAATLILATTTNPPLFLSTQTLTSNEQNANADYADQLQYIRNDVAKADGVTTSIASIKLTDDSYIGLHSAALVTKTDGSTLLYMWGSNSQGQIGFDQTGSRPNPTATQLIIPNLGTRKITRVDLGETHSAALLDDGSLYMWGDNRVGQLGSLGLPFNPTPTQVTIPDLGNRTISKIDLGSFHSSALLDDGSLYIWGQNKYGQLGNTTNFDTEEPNPTPTQVIIPDLGTRKIAQLMLGAYYSGAQLDDGSVYTWGRNLWGQLGYTMENGDETNPTPTQVIIPDLGNRKISKVKFGGDHSAALLDDDSLYMWGDNRFGQLGYTIEGINKNPTPTQVIIPDLDNRKITQIILGYRVSAVLLDDNSLYMWGINNTGQLGYPKPPDTSATPTKVIIPDLGDRKILEVSLGQEHSSVVLNDGSLYFYGSNSRGQIGFPLSEGSSFFKPTRMMQLGKDSHITANTTLTAGQAVNKIWVDNKFNMEGFKNAFNLTNITDVYNQEITMENKPRFDSKARTVTMNIGIKYFYDENGFLAPKKTTEELIITDFKESLSETIIMGKTEQFPIDIREWEKIAINGNKLERSIVDNYLQFTRVPDNAEFTLSNLNLNYKTGVAAFDLVSSSILTEGDDTPVVEDSDPFSITLNLEPKFTIMSPIAADYPDDLTAADLKTKLFGTSTTVINSADLEAYMSVTFPANGVTYHLIEDSWNSQSGDGTLQFSIYADKFYDEEKEPSTGGPDVTESIVNFDLKLQRGASNIEVLPMPLKNIRVDKFEEYIKQDDNAIVRTRLEEFFDLKTVPTDAIFTINNVTVAEYGDNSFRDFLTLNLTIDKYNISANETISHTQDFILTLEPQHLPTTFETKTTDQINSSVMQFIPSFASDGTNVDNFDVLKQYVDIKSYPSDATFKLSDVNKNPDTGIVSFKLIASQGYDANSDLQSNVTSELFTFQLLPKKLPIEIILNPNITNPDPVDEFINQVQTLSGTPALESYLFPKYLTMSGDLPPNTVFHVESISKDNDVANGLVFLKIYPSQYYDDNDNIVPGVPTEKVFAIQVQAPFSKIKPKTNYPKDIRVDDFLEMLEANSVFDRAGIEQYFTLTDVPVNAVFTIKEPRLAPYINGVRTNITFNLETSVFNKEDGSTGAHTQKFTLVLGTQHEPTSIQPKTPYDDSLRVDDVYNKLQTLTGEDLTNYLKNFLDIHSVPAGTTFSILNLPQDVPTAGQLSFSVLPSQVYDNNSDISTENIAPIELTLDLGKVYPPTTITQKTPTPVRIDTFVDNINNLKNKALYDYLVTEYINAESVFDPASMSAQIESQNYLTGEVIVTYTIIGYYNESSNFVNQAKSYTFAYKLTPIYPSTSISVLDNYAKDITPEQFKQKIIDDGAIVSGNNFTLLETNIAFLEKFINFASVPSIATYTLTINNDLTDNATGVLNFNLSLDHHYANGNFENDVLTVNNLVLNLAPQPVDEEVVTYPPTVLTTSPNAPLIKSAQDFIDTVYPNGIVNLQMLRTYVNGLDTLPSSASITNLSIKDSNIATFTLAVSAHYNSVGILAGATTYDFNLGLTPKYTPTTITVLPGGIYPKDLTPEAFKQQIIDDGASISGNNYSLTATNIKFLKRFLDLSTVPANTTYTLIFNDVNDIMGQLDFSLMLNQFYDNDGELVNDGTNKTFHGLKLNLTPVDTPFAYPETQLSTKANPTIFASPDHFMEMIYDADGVLDRIVLNQFIEGFGSIPTTASIEIKLVANNEGIATYSIHISHYFDEDGVLRTEYQGTAGRTYTFNVNVAYTPTIIDPITPENKNDDLLWLWIVIGISGAAIFVLLARLIIKRINKDDYELTL